MAPKKSLPAPQAKAKAPPSAPAPSVPSQPATAAAPESATKPAPPSATPQTPVAPSPPVANASASPSPIKTLTLEMERQAANKVPTALSGLISLILDDSSSSGSALPPTAFVGLRVLHRLQVDRFHAAQGQARHVTPTTAPPVTPAATTGGEGASTQSTAQETAKSSTEEKPPASQPSSSSPTGGGPQTASEGPKDEPATAAQPSVADKSHALGAAPATSAPPPEESSTGANTATAQRASSSKKTPTTTSQSGSPGGAAPAGTVKSANPHAGLKRTPSSTATTENSNSNTAAAAKNSNTRSPLRAPSPPKPQQQQQQQSKQPETAPVAPDTHKSTTSNTSGTTNRRGVQEPSSSSPPQPVAETSSATMLVAALLVASDPSLHPLTSALAQSVVAPEPQQQQAGPSSPPLVRRAATRNASPTKSRPQPLSPVVSDQQAQGGSFTTASAGGRSPTRVIVRPSSPSSPDAIEAARRIKAQMKKTQEMRAERRRLEQEKIQRDLAEAEEAAKRALQRQEEERREKERQLNDRLEQLRAKREERELEYMIGERRAHKILRERTLAEEMEEQFQARQREERRQKELEWLKKREQLRAPLTDGLDEIAKRLRENEERKQRREMELKESWKLLEQQQVKVHQGPSYSLAVDEFLKAKHVEDDERHARLYRHAKMQEYGRIVKAMVDAAAAEDESGGGGRLRRRHSHSGGSTPLAQGPLRPLHNGRPTPHTPPPFDASPLPHAKALASPTVPKPSLPPHERNQFGNNYLKQAIQLKSQLPPGLKVAPLEDERRQQEFDRFKMRKKKGDQYLKELRDMQLTPAPPVVDEFEFVGDVRKLKTKVHRLEREAETITMAIQQSSTTGESPSRVAEAVAAAAAAKKKRKSALVSSSPMSLPDDPLEADVVANEKILEMVQTKCALLSKIATHP